MEYKYTPHTCVCRNYEWTGHYWRVVTTRNMLHTKLFLILLLLMLLTLTTVGGGVLRWLFGGDSEDYEEEEEDEYDDTVTDGPFNMITETYIEDEDYDL